MKSPLIEALFGSAIKAKLVQWLYVEADPTQSYPLSVLARHTGVPLPNLTKPVNQLIEAQYLVRETTDLGHRYRAPHEDPRLHHLFLFLRQDSAIVGRLRRTMKKLKGVTYACVFGSFARGDTHRNSDIDVLVLEGGESDSFAVYAACSKLGDALGRPVNPQIYPVAEFDALVASGNPLALSILGHRIDLKGDVPPWQNSDRCGR